MLIDNLLCARQASQEFILKKEGSNVMLFNIQYVQEN